MLRPRVEPDQPEQPVVAARDLAPESIEGNRFDAADSDESYQPNLEEDPDTPADILPDDVRRLPRPH